MVAASAHSEIEIEVASGADAGTSKVLRRAASFDVVRRSRRRPPSTAEAQQAGGDAAEPAAQSAAAPAAQPGSALAARSGNKLVRTLSAPRQRRGTAVHDRASQLDGADASSPGCLDAEGDDHAPSEWLQTLMARARASDPTLRSLVLSGHIEMATLSRAQQSETILDLRANSTLTELACDRLQLNDAAARAIASLLAPAGTPPLLKLSLERNNFTDAGALALCAALASNARLAELSVADQLRAFSQSTVIAFCEMLEGRAPGGAPDGKPNYSLRRLNLGRHQGPVQRLSKLVMVCVFCVCVYVCVCVTH
jgi:hypothetical protein